MMSRSEQVLVSKRVPILVSFRQKSVTPLRTSGLYPAARNLFAWAFELAAADSSGLAAPVAALDTVDGALATGVAAAAMN